MSTATQVSSNKVFGGLQNVYKHKSSVLGCDMTFAVFFPKVNAGYKSPILYWLSGLTCNEQNFITKAGGQKYAQQAKIAIVCPDTSPRGCNIAGEDDSYDFGSGAGFYLDATKQPWDKNYKMYTYITKELPQVLQENFSDKLDTCRASLCGHSMGGHGALTIALSNPGKYKSVSAFAPICNPINCPWGQKAFKNYLGEDQLSWKKYDATELSRSYPGPPLKILIDQGSDDQFLGGQLFPQNLINTSSANAQLKIEYRLQQGYDHSYFFIASFIQDHIALHGEALNG